MDKHFYAYIANKMAKRYQQIQRMAWRNGPSNKMTNI